MDRLTKADDRKWFYLAMGLVSVLSVDFVYRKVKKCIKKNKQSEVDGENVHKNEKINLNSKSTNNQNKSVFAPQNSILESRNGKFYVEEAQNKLKSYQAMFKPQNIYKICLTGGPCAGKTTAMTHISEKLREMGIRVYIVPEAATLIANGGGMIEIGKMNTYQRLKLQTVIIEYIMNMEDHFVSLASINENPDEIAVVLCDRGAMDGSAYMTKEEWQALLDEHGWNTVNLRDKRYDGVIHMVTAADGAEDFYSLENNQARYESTVELAREIDQKLRSAWVGHPQFVIVHNTFKSFEEKVRRVYTTVLHMIGRPQEAPKFYKKYLLEKDGDSAIPKLPDDPNLRIETFTMQDTYLESLDSKAEEKIRKRGQKDSFSYTHSITLYDYDFVNAPVYKNDGVETKKQITAREYLFLLERRDRNSVTLQKLRQCFIWEGQHYFIDTFINVGGGFSLLMIEKGKDIKLPNLPPFIKIKRDVTDLREASSYELAKISNSKLNLFSVLGQNAIVQRK